MKHESKGMKNLGIVFTLLFALGLTVSSVKTAAAEDMRQIIEAANAKWMAAFNHGDAAALAALYTEDATLMPPGSEIIEGRQGIQDFWQGAIQSGLKDASLTTVSVQANGDAAYEIGKFSLFAVVQDQDPKVISGKYVVVWKKGEDGVWKLNVDIWNSSMAAQ